MWIAKNLCVDKDSLRTSPEWKKKSKSPQKKMKETIANQRAQLLDSWTLGLFSSTKTNLKGKLAKFVFIFFLDIFGKDLQPFFFWFYLLILSGFFASSLPFFEKLVDIVLCGCWSFGTYLFVDVLATIQTESTLLCVDVWVSRRANTTSTTMSRFWKWSSSDPFRYTCEKLMDNKLFLYLSNSFFPFSLTSIVINTDCFFSI